MRTVDWIFITFLWVNFKEIFPTLFHFLFTCWGRSGLLLAGCTNGVVRFPFPSFYFLLSFLPFWSHLFMSFTGWTSIKSSSPYHTGLAKFVSYISLILPTRWILVSFVFTKIVFSSCYLSYLHKTSNLWYSMWSSSLKVNLIFSSLYIVEGTEHRLLVISTQMSTICFPYHIDTPVVVKRYFWINIIRNGKGL